MAQIYTPLTSTPSFSKIRSILRQLAPGMGPSICLHVEIAPLNFGPPGSFPSILGKEDEKCEHFCRLRFFPEYFLDPDLFRGRVRKSCARIPIRGVPNSVRRAPNRKRNLSQKNADFAIKIVDFDVPESDFRAAAQHGLMRGGSRPSTTFSRALRTPSRRHRGAPTEANQNYKLGFQPIPRIRVCNAGQPQPAPLGGVDSVFGERARKWCLACLHRGDHRFSTVFEPQ